MFSALDRDNSGTIDVGELRLGLGRLGLGLTVAQFEWLMRTLDADGDGVIRHFAPRILHALYRVQARCKLRLYFFADN